MEFYISTLTLIILIMLITKFLYINTHERYLSLINKQLSGEAKKLARKIYIEHSQYLFGACMFVLSKDECPHMYRYIQELGVRDIHISIVKNYFCPHIAKIAKIIRNNRTRRNITLIQNFTKTHIVTQQIPYLPVIGVEYKKCLEKYKNYSSRKISSHSL